MKKLIFILSLFLIAISCESQVPGIGGVQKPIIVEAGGSYCDITTLTYVDGFNVYTQAPSPFDVAFNNDGTKMYVLDFTNDRVYQYSLSTAWDVTTATYDSKNIYAKYLDDYLSGLEFNTDGTKMYVAGWQYDKIHQFTLSTAWDISTATDNSINYSFGYDVRTIRFKVNGTKLYVVDYTNDAVKEYTLSTAYDLSTMSLTNTMSTTPQGVLYPNGVEFSPDGLIMLVLPYQSDTDNAIRQYLLSTAWDISTATFDVNSDSYWWNNYGGAIVQNIRVSPDYTKLYTADVTDYIQQLSICGN